MKILINTPSINKLGGVANHYLGLKNFWNENVVYHTIGTRNKIPGFFWLIPDFIMFFFKVISFKPNFVLLNPSLQKKALKRDVFYSKICGFLGVKHFVFIHGWDINMEREIDKNPKIFKEGFKNASGFFVLSNLFKEKIIYWNCNQKVYITTTKVDDELIKNFSIRDKKYNKKILFLARIEKNKGIYETIEIYKRLKIKDFSYTLSIAGIGSELERVKEFVKNEKIEDITFHGFLKGEQLKELFSKSSIYLLPTSHGEGLPTSILEAMAFGLVIFTSNVGGIKDLYEKVKFGSLIKPENISNYVFEIDKLWNDEFALKTKGCENYNYVLKNLTASRIAKKIEITLKNHV